MIIITVFSESALHAKLEKDRIFKNVKKITDILNTQKPNEVEVLNKYEKEKGLR